MKRKHASLRFMKAMGMIPGATKLMDLLYKRKAPSLSTELFGLNFPNPLGMGGDFDQDGALMDIMDNMGFGFVEICSPSTKRLTKSRHDLIIAADICNGKKLKDIDSLSVECDRNLALLYDFADMFVVDLCTMDEEKDLHFQDINFLTDLIARLHTTRLFYDRYKPLLLKLSSKLPLSLLDNIIDTSMASGIDGIIINSYGSFTDLKATIRYIDEHSHSNYLVAASGISTPKEAKECLENGACLVEISSGFAERGPEIVKETLKYCKHTI